MTVVVKYDHFLFADQKVPVTPDAVVAPSLSAKQRAIAQRPDYKLVPNARRVLPWAENVTFPEVHEKALNAFSGPPEKVAESKAKLKLGHRAASA
jgi:hypothetical protein